MATTGTIKIFRIDDGVEKSFSLKRCCDTFPDVMKEDIKRVYDLVYEAFSEDYNWDFPNMIGAMFIVINANDELKKGVRHPHIHYSIVESSDKYNDFKLDTTTDRWILEYLDYDEDTDSDIIATETLTPEGNWVDRKVREDDT